jgi:hypothetical protein
LIKDIIDLYNDFTNEFLEILDIIMEGFDEDIVIMSENSINYFKRSEEQSDSTIEEHSEDEIESIPSISTERSEERSDERSIIEIENEYIEPEYWNTDEELKAIIKELEEEMGISTNTNDTDEEFDVVYSIE